MPTPTIKGMFINSHIKRLKNERGEDAVRELEREFGRPLAFHSFSDYPVRDEVRIIELTLKHMRGPIEEERRSFEAGRLHFQNFSGTPFGRILLSAIPRTSFGLKNLLASSRHIVRHVFKHTNFDAETRGDARLKIVMENGDYPIDHFRGLLFEWVSFWGMEDPRVDAKESAPGKYEYEISWT